MRKHFRFHFLLLLSLLLSSCFINFNSRPFTIGVFELNGRLDNHIILNNESDSILTASTFRVEIASEEEYVENSSFIKTDTKDKDGNCYFNLRILLSLQNKYVPCSLVNKHKKGSASFSHRFIMKFEFNETAYEVEIIIFNYKTTIYIVSYRGNSNSVVKSLNLNYEYIERN